MPQLTCLVSSNLSGSRGLRGGVPRKDAHVKTQPREVHERRSGQEAQHVAACSMNLHDLAKGKKKDKEGIPDHV